MLKASATAPACREIYAASRNLSRSKFWNRVSRHGGHSSESSGHNSDVGCGMGDREGVLSRVWYPRTSRLSWMPLVRARASKKHTGYQDFIKAKSSGEGS